MTPGERRFVGVLGLAGLVLNTAAFGLFVADVPAIGDAAATEFAAWLTENRTEILAGLILIALGWTASVGFLAGVRAELRAAGSGVVADIGLVAVVVLFAVVAAGGVAVQAAALVAGADGGISPELARLASATLFTAFAVSAAPTLLFTGAYAWAIFTSGALPRWAGWGLVVVGIVHLGALVSVAQSGVFAPEGAFAFAAPALYEIWQTLVAIQLFRRAPEQVR